MAHTIEEDFEHFLSYSGLSSESAKVKDKLFKAYETNWMNTDPEIMARLFHDTYEKLAPQFGYETRVDTREFDKNSVNGALMVAVCREIFINGTK